tara:strand:- start:3490 stop:3909 length:420 start_codon:yes stop_codon:yes gene_type:complete
MTGHQELQQLAKKFPSALIQQNPNGFGDYVKHSVVCEKLLAVIGPFTWEIVREITDADGTLSGCIGRLTCEIDGRTVSVDGAGDVERTEILSNNGTRLKHAESDALKRAAARLGCGTHLWSGVQYRLDRALAQKADDDA